MEVLNQRNTQLITKMTTDYLQPRRKTENRYNAYFVNESSNFCSLVRVTMPIPSCAASTYHSELVYPTIDGYMQSTVLIYQFINCSVCA